MQAAASVLLLCFPPRLMELLQARRQQQQQQQPEEFLIDAVAALLCPAVAPVAVLRSVQPQLLTASNKLSLLAGGQQPLDLFVRGATVSLGNMVLTQLSQPAEGPQQQQQHPKQHKLASGLLLHSQRSCMSAVAAALAANFPVLLTGERGGGRSLCLCACQLANSPFCFCLYFVPWFFSLHLTPPVRLRLSLQQFLFLSLSSRCFSVRD